MVSYKTSLPREHCVGCQDTKLPHGPREKNNLRDQKNTQPWGPKEKSSNLSSQKKIMQPLGPKIREIMEIRAL